MATLAGKAHGVVTRAQLRRAGLTPAEIKHRLASGALSPIHRGVYRVGHRAPSMEATYLAAVRACGNGAVLSGRAAAHLLYLLKGKPPPPEVSVASRKRVPGLRVRRSLVPSDERRFWRGIPVTSVPRTLVDMAAGLGAEDLARACHEAGVRYKTTPSHVEKVLARRPNTSGAGKLRVVMSGDVPALLGELEKGFNQLLRGDRLDLPDTNRPAGAHRVDCRWPKHRLTVELDSYRFHNSRYAWEQDRKREREARARGDEFRRYTWGDVFETPELTLEELRSLLAGLTLNR